MPSLIIITNLLINVKLPTQALLGKALASGGHPAEAIAYIAVHGTGTPLGDPIEIGALAAALASRSALGLSIGSVKVQQPCI